jgi:rRNA maturation endonuclease Nob1
MDTKERSPRRERRSRDFYSCAFCHEKSPKPFKICESCGTSQPKASEEE